MSLVDLIRSAISQELAVLMIVVGLALFVIGYRQLPPR
jgi:hypothetical protein